MEKTNISKCSLSNVLSATIIEVFYSLFSNTLQAISWCLWQNYCRNLKQTRAQNATFYRSIFSLKAGLLHV